MEKISSYNIAVSVDTLREGFNSGQLVPALHGPLQSLLPRVTRAAAEAPASVYLFSAGDGAEVRDLFGFALVAALSQQIPTALLVDCGFLAVGLSGVVPQKDALGFLDLLLYGSSLGVITQKTNGGVHVVGAGSFPVTKNMPFVLNAFEEASRRLVSQCRCAVFCGPLYNDEGALHPLIGAVDVPIMVRLAGTGGSIVDPIEEQISSKWDSELLSVRVTPRDAAAAPPPATVATGVVDEKPVVPATPAAAPPSQHEFEEIVPPAPPRPARVETPKPAPARTPKPAPAEVAPVADVEFEEESTASQYKEKKYSSLVPKIATAVVATVVVVFLVWWFNEERTGGGGSEPPQTTGSSAVSDVDDAGAETPTVVVVDSTVVDSTVVDGTAAVAVAADTTAAQPEPEPTGAAGAVSSDDILVMDDLENNWGGQYLIHISSFRDSGKARTEVGQLTSRGFSVFIVYLNLGAKGSWYRVYAGPVATREDARNMKKLLDDTPGVRFTRISQIAN